MYKQFRMFLLPVFAGLILTLTAAVTNGGIPSEVVRHSGSIAQPYEIHRQMPRPIIARHPSRTYMVNHGDTLSSIAAKIYGKSSDWPALWYRNRAKIRNPNIILAGTELRLGSLTVTRKILRKALRAVSPGIKPGNSVSPASPTSATPPQISSGVYSFGAIEQLWVNAGGPSWAESQAATVAECESGGNPRAYNPSGASGIWQILGQVVAGNIFDPMVNALNAVSKFKASGNTFSQWVCQP